MTKSSAPILLCLIAPLFVSSIFAQNKKKDDGKELYELHCSACHGVNGEGANDGAFPPLAGSEWLLGDSRRTIAIIMKGLSGPITVSGKQYNLVMPPHGDSLGTRKVYNIVNYINSAWGNRGEKIKPDLVRTVRAEFADRTKPWTAPELLKLYPLPKIETPLKNVLSYVYKGKWEQLPDFTQLKSENVEEEAEGMINVSVSPHKAHFGIVWTADFMAENDGTHYFYVDADDSARIIINGQKVAEVAGLGPMNGKRAKQGKIDLKKGKNSLRVEYLEYTGQKGISIGWKTDPKLSWKWLTPQASAPKKPYPDIFLIPDDETIIYRNFIKGTTPRALGFGFPNATSLAYSADNLAPEILWAGDFINAGRHWTNRGQGFEPPASEAIFPLTKERFLPKNARFKGYSLDEKSNPTFKVQIEKAMLTDSWTPSGSGVLIRTLKLSSGAPIKIPTGSKELTGQESVTLEPGKEIKLTYKLK